MPVFSRVRIINISYDNRYIDDCIFDFYNGCDTFMNLANGSGKTVMVEVLFQPIIPNMKIGRWKITDYLTGDSRPTFVLIEWLLDNTNKPEYLLTGICLSIARQDSDEAQSQRSLKYFTFTHRYSRGNEYDIANIPLTIPFEGKTRVPTYNEIYDVIKSYSRSHGDFDFFTKDKSQEYKNKLSEYYIFREEWELLERVNQAESGVGLSALFEQCKTSDQLFDRWILQTVSDTDRQQRSSLIAAIPELVKPILQSDESLSEKQLYEELESDLSDFEECFKSYINIVDSKEKHEQYMAGILSYIYSMISQANTERDRAAALIEECSIKIRRIEHERLSEEYLETEREKTLSEQKLSELKRQLPLLQSQKERSEHEFRCMDAARIFEQIQSNRAKLEAERNTINTIKNNEQSKRIYDLGFSLYRAYSEKLSMVTSQCSEIFRSQEQLEAEDVSLTAQSDKISQRRILLNKDLGRIEARSERFNSFKAECKELLGSLPEENLLGELDADSTMQHRKLIQKEITKLQGLIDKKKKTKLATEKDRDESNDIINRVIVRSAEKKHQIEESENRLREFTEVRNKQTEILLRYGIEERFLYDKKNNLIRLREIISTKRRASDNEKLTLSSLEEKLRALRSNRLYVSPEFNRFLSEIGIDFQTGEAYLKSQSEEFQQKLLSDNPLLPYCFIVNNKKDFDRTIAASSELFADRICPLICRQSLDYNISSGDREAKLDPLRLFALYDSKSFAPNSKDTYEKQLILQIEKKKEAIRSLETSIDELKRAIDFTESFSYTADYEQSINSQLQRQEDELSNLEKQLIQTKENKEKALEQIKTLEAEVSQLETNLQSAEKRQQCLESYINAAYEAYETKAKSDKIKSELDALDREQDRIVKKKEDIASKIKYCIQNCAKLENEKARIESEKSKYAAYTEGQLIIGDIEQLVQEYNNLHSTYKETVAYAEKICKDLECNIDRLNGEIRQSWPELKPDDYQIEFDSSRLKYLQSHYEKCNDDLIKAETDKRSEESIYNSRKKDFDRRKRELNSNGFTSPLSEREILGNFVERRSKCLEEQRDAENIRDESISRLEKLNSNKSKLERYVEADENTEQVTDEVVLKDVINLLRQLQSQADSHRSTVNNEYTNLRSKYASRSEYAGSIVLLDSFESNQSYTQCYYIYTQLMEKQKFLHDEIQLLNTKLENITENRNHIVEQIKHHAEFLYEGVRRVSENSFVPLHGKRQRVLDIQLPDSIDNQHQSRIENMVDDILSKLREHFSLKDYAPSELSDSVDELFSDRSIFNAYIGESTIRIRVWKELEDSRNSRLVAWGSRFSGGESFITYIIIYSVLADYARSKKGTADSRKIRSVFLVDNPFGEASSAHLLEALAGVTKKFNLQLICLSALNQESITKNFDLIYQLSMHRATYSSKSLMKIDKTMVLNHDIAERTSELEYVPLYRKQITLF